VFGRENQVAGSIILNNVERFDELTDAVTDTNVAFEQAEIVSQTLAFQTQQTEATYEALVLSLDNGNGALSETASNYEKTKQSLFEFLTVANDATASNEELFTSFRTLFASIDEFAGGGVLSQAEANLKGIELARDRFVQKNVEAAIAIEDQAKALGLSDEQQIQQGVALEAQIDKQVVKVKELLAETLTLDGFEREAARAKLATQKRILDGLDAEVEKRKAAQQQALLGGVGPSQSQLDAINALAITDDPGTGGAGDDKKKDDREKLERQLAGLRAESLEDARERELALLDLKLSDELKKFKGNKEAENLLDKQFREERAEINRQFDQIGVDQNQQALQFAAEARIISATELNAELAKIELQRLEQQRALLIQGQQDTAEIDAQIVAQKKEVTLSQLEDDVFLAERKSEVDKLEATNTISNAEELADREIEIEIAKLEAIIALRKAAGEDTLSQEQELANLRLGIRQEEIAAEEVLIEQRKAKAVEFAQTLRAIAELEMQKRLDAELATIATEAQLQTDAIDKELENEELTEEQRAKLIEERTAVEQEADRKSREIQREAAERQKSIALAEILINGAVAFSKALTVDPTGILALFTAAQVLAQFSLVAATPIPAFAKGTNYSPEGVALVGEKGPELVYLPRGSQVKTADQTKNILSDTASGAQLTRMLDEQTKIEYYVKHETNYSSSSKAGGIGSLAFTDSAKRDRKIYNEINDNIGELLHEVRAAKKTGRGW